MSQPRPTDSAGVKFSFQPNSKAFEKRSVKRNAAVNRRTVSMAAWNRIGCDRIDCGAGLLSAKERRLPSHFPRKTASPQFSGR